METLKESVEQQFSRTADAYRTSSVHAGGADLEQMVALAALTGREAVLDAGCGAGHTAAALAPFARSVVAFDLSERMLAVTAQLAAARGLTNLTTRQGDVEALPFDDASFDLVVSRYSAHHWPHPQAALAEIRRVLKPGGHAILQTPYSDLLASTLCDPGIATDEARLQVYGQEDHVRMYGRDIFARFAGAGFQERVVRHDQALADIDAGKFGLNAQEPFFLFEATSA